MEIASNIDTSGASRGRLEKAKLIARWGRKATGLTKTTGMPEAQPGCSIL